MHAAHILGDPPPIDTDALAQISRLVYRHTGIRLGPRKGYFVEARLLGLYRDLGCSCWEELPQRLDAQPEALEQLIQSVITGETRFFRDDLPFQALSEVMVPAFAAQGARPMPFRVWSAGCSTGQEPYSIAMSLWDEVARGGLDLEISATDICHASLARAREGRYAPRELERGVDATRRTRFFREGTSGTAQVREDLRRRVRFRHLNLMTEDPPGLFHAIFCRNVAIYFDREGKERVYGKLGAALLPGGYLVLGAAETLFPGASGFETVYFRRSLLFRRRAGDSR
jgi:chemotaxis protein methyltransferase CheR